MNQKINYLAAILAMVGGGVGYYFSPSPRNFFGYVASAAIACVVGWTTAHASRLEYDHQLLLALVVGIASNKMLDHLLVGIWRNRETTVTHNYNAEVGRTNVAGDLNGDYVQGNQRKQEQRDD